ncbi:MAG: hypothetical protein R2854_03870 [Caldilineaceae bacterium]
MPNFRRGMHVALNSHAHSLPPRTRTTQQYTKFMARCHTAQAGKSDGSSWHANATRPPQRLERPCDGRNSDPVAAGLLLHTCHEIEQLIDQDFPLGGGEIGAAEHAALGIDTNEFGRGPFDGGMNCVQLLENVTAVPLVVEHLLNAAGLAFDSAQPGMKTGFDFRRLNLHGRTFSANKLFASSRPLR